ncbi:rhamnogalacturonan acetylesterase [Sphingomonas sp. AX6]|uniref:rhamnogalacturonan acetylesterase n=1 Tax=Sphingomonas sp. AX6 TaxID=2653171 RepID=UPI0012F3EE73|nr:rhamnogalacturonan acetylesterase [Sphingomonas sp. AX6]
MIGRAIVVAALIGMAVPAAAQSAVPRSFSFDGSGDSTAVSPDKMYDGDHGFEGTTDGVSRVFSVALPEGNYRVTMRIGDRARAADTSVKAETRRLMLRNIRTRRGQFETRSFVVNVRDAALPAPPKNAPGGDRVRLFDREAGSPSWDDRLTIEWLGGPAVASLRIEPVDVPTLYLVGDSTVTDQRSEPAASWGQMLPALLDDRVAVANHAESGETLKSFLTGLRFDKVLSRMKPGDYLFIQFGHNDQKEGWPQTHVDPTHTYPAYLRAYIAEAQRRGAHPVLVTSPERRTFEGTRIRSTLADYVAAAKRVAAEERIPLIDLNAASTAIYEALGPQRAPLAFNDGGRDATHHNNYGAWLLANAVAEQMRGIVELAPHVVAPRFDPARPPLPEAVTIEPSIARSNTRPVGD